MAMKIRNGAQTSLSSPSRSRCISQTLTHTQAGGLLLRSEPLRARMHPRNSGACRILPALLALCMALLAGTALGQTTTGSIFGTVTDQTGGVIANAAITATDVATGISRTTQSNASGNYLFPAVPA